MPRIKRGTISKASRTSTLKQTKGFRWDRKSKERAAKEALLHAYSNMYRGRKEKKREFRSLWQLKINAGARIAGMKYNTFINALKVKNVALDRKILADLAEHQPEIFKKIVEQVK